MNSDFCKWLESRGAKFTNLELRNIDGYRTMFSKTNISNGEKIISIPLSLIITYEKAVKSPINRRLKGLIECEHTIFAIFLLEERELLEKSEWHEYIKMFPSNYDHMSLYFGEELLDLLRGTLAMDKIKGRKIQLREEYHKICMLESSFEKRFTLDDFIWGRLVTITRIFGFDVNSVKTSGLVPVADMLNHKNPDKNGNTETSWSFDDTTQSFCVLANKNIRANREIYDSYGFKCNSRFFVNYGFTVEDNDDDDETHMFEGEFHITGFYRQTREGVPKTRQMFDSLRKKVSATEKCQRELETLKLLKEGVTRRLSDFRENIDTYRQLICSEVDFRRKCCYSMCLSELKIIKKFERMCNYLIPILEKNNIKKLIDKKGRVVKSGLVLIDEYISDVFAL